MVHQVVLNCVLNFALFLMIIRVSSIINFNPFSTVNRDTYVRVLQMIGNFLLFLGCLEWWKRKPENVIQKTSEKIYCSSNSDENQTPENSTEPGITLAETQIQDATIQNL